MLPSCLPAPSWRAASEEGVASPWGGPGADLNQRNPAGSPPAAAAALLSWEAPGIFCSPVGLQCWQSRDRIAEVEKVIRNPAELQLGR